MEGTEEANSPEAIVRPEGGEELRVAVCDLDGTYLDTNSFSRFTAWLARRRPALLPALARIVVARKRRLVSHAEAKQRILALAAPALSAGEIEKWGAKLLKCHTRHHVVTILDRYRKQGCRTMLATAAPALYAEALARLAGFDYVLATPTGGEENVGTEKRRNVVDWFGSEEARPVAFLTDHDDDLPLADWVTGQGGRLHLIR